LEDRREWIEPKHLMLSIARQCALVGVSRSSYYYEPLGAEREENLNLMRVLDRLYLKRPFYGVPRMTDWLRELGYRVNHKRVERLMRLMGLQATLPGPHTSQPHPEHVIYPYLLRDLKVERPNQVWCADITYVPMRRGSLDLVAVMDWFSRSVLSWELSNTLEVAFCVEALERALAQGCPDIFNTDQGSQFTAEQFTGFLERAGVTISMDGRGRAMDNVMGERLWRTVKYEDIYLRDYANGVELRLGLGRYFRFYNTERPHQGLGKRTPAEVHFGGEKGDIRIWTESRSCVIGQL
jgi:putative transposase